MPNFSGYLEQHRQAMIDDLCELLAIPSVSADSRHREDVRKAAQWVHNQFSQMGLDTQTIDTPGHPIVYAESPPIEGAPTILVYGHYDVQPADPLEEWETPPFEPTCRNGNVYARGATDDKGQMLTHIKSAQAWMSQEGRLPVQLKFLIEGEEEVGSESIEAFLKEQKSRLACDVAVISDTSQYAPGQPAITYGLKGIAYFELRLQGPGQDLHSGTFGGAVTNPANALARILGQLVDNQGRITLPGFYDDVLDLTDREREQFAALPFSEKEFMAQVGVNGVSGEAGYTTLERRWTRPTCDINGLWSGYQGEGAKTVLPARAGAKFSFRLVPNQSPKQVSESLKQWLAERMPVGITYQLQEAHGAPGVVVSLDSPYMAAAAAAIEQGFGAPPVYIREGGSIPIVTTFKQLLGVDTLLLGWGQNDDNMHSPNEKFSLDDFHRGVAASIQLWDELSRIPS